jgi:hypothetical protein
MKHFVTVVAIFTCILVIVLGKIHFSDKIAQTTAQATEKVEEREEKVEKNIAAEKEAELDAFKKLTINLPESIAEKALKARESEEVISVLVMGSDLVNNKSWTENLPKQLNEVYGGEIFTFSFVNLGKNDSLVVFHNDLHKKALEQSADLVIYEPLVMNDLHLTDDTGRIRMEDTLYVVNKITQDIEEVNPEVAIMLMPANPLYEYISYDTSIEDLKEFAKEEGFPFINHWDAWPETDDEELIDYLKEDELTPNEKGYETWVNAVVDYLSGK